MRFETQPISFKPKSLKDDPYAMDLLLKKSIQLGRKRPSLEDFLDIYSKEEIEKDRQKLKIRQQQWDENNDEYQKFMRDFSSIYEATITSILNQNKFLGEGEVIQTSVYDDVFNGVDSIFIRENKEGNQYLGLNMDVTFSSDHDNLCRKIESIKQTIRSGDLATLKYFQDLKTKEHKKLSLPKVIIGSQQSSADGLIRLWGETSRNDEEKLKNHPIQSKIIMEILAQLIYFCKFAKNLSENTREYKMREKYQSIYIKYGEMYNHFYDIYIEKEDLIKSHYNEVIKDEVYKEIVRLTE